MMEEAPPLVLTNCRLATMAGADYGLVDDAVVVIRHQHIAFTGPRSALSNVEVSAEVIDLRGRLLTPGLIDCHTHLVHGGSRAEEFEMRQNGASYEEISRAGGGIFSTVRATRKATEAQLLDTALQRLDALMLSGVTTVEVKSGYGLDLATEKKMLRVARRLEAERPIRVLTTFLGAHAVPPGSDPDAYLDDVCLPALLQLAEEGLVDAVDAFCEGIGFNPTQVERLFREAQRLGLPVKLHAEQLSSLSGATLAANFNALSADHLEYATQADIDAMASSDTVAVMLPGAFYFLREAQKPPISALRAAGVPMAVATDNNPGSSPMTSLLLAMNMSTILFGLTPLEALQGTTVNAAKALGLEKVGILEQGFQADLAVWDVTHPAELAYQIGGAPLHRRVVGGRLC